MATQKKSGKKSRFSYSKIDTYRSCGWKYYLTYQEGHYIFSENVTTEFGTLVHFIEQQIGIALMNGTPVNYAKLKDDFQNINIPKTSKYDRSGGIYGTNILKKRYPLEFLATDERGKSFATKAEDYLDYGIYRLEKWMQEHPTYKIFGLEQNFEVEFEGETFAGAIDRIFYDEERNAYLIEDIKTKDKPFRDEDLPTPLQFVVYTLALRSIINDPEAKIECQYDFPFCDLKQPAGTAGYMDRGTEKLRSLFSGIRKEEFAPGPSPLCAWCQFSPTNPNQPKEGEGLCPYHSLWTPGNRTHKVAAPWKGMAHHKEAVERKETIKKELDIDFDF